MSKNPQHPLNTAKFIGIFGDRCARDHLSKPTCFSKRYSSSPVTTAPKNWHATYVEHFFAKPKNISDHSLLLDIAEDENLNTASLQQVMGDGAAMAALSDDLRNAATRGVKGSPTWVLNDGRQVLYGNVGYRILSSNIEELLKHPGTEASWC